MEKKDWWCWILVKKDGEKNWRVEYEHASADILNQELTKLLAKYGTANVRVLRSLYIKTIMIPENKVTVSFRVVKTAEEVPPLP